MSSTRPSAIDLSAAETPRRSKSPVLVGVCAAIIASALGWLALSVTQILAIKKNAQIHGVALDIHALPHEKARADAVLLCKAVADDPAKPGSTVDLLGLAKEYQKELNNIAEIGNKREPRQEASAAVDTLLSGTEKFAALNARFARCLKQALLVAVRCKPDGSYMFVNVPPGEYVIGMGDDLAGAQRVTVKQVDLTVNIDY